MRIPRVDCLANFFVDRKSEVWTVAFRAFSSSNPSKINAGLCGLFRSQAAEEGIVSWHHASDPSWSWENFWGCVGAVPRFHREELVLRGGGEWSLHSTEHGRDSSVGMGAASSPFSRHYFVTLPWKTTWAATPAWLLCPDLSERLKASFTHPRPHEYVLCVPTNLLTVLVIQSLTLFDKQMPGGLIKHVYRNIALCLKLDLPA